MEQPQNLEVELWQTRSRRDEREKQSDPLPRSGVLRSSDDTLCNFERGLFPQSRWATSTPSKPSETAKSISSRHETLGFVLKCSDPRGPPWPTRRMGMSELRSVERSEVNVHRMTVLLRRNPTQTASRYSGSLPVHEMVFCSLRMTLSATSHGDFLSNTR